MKLNLEERWRFRATLSNVLSPGKLGLGGWRVVRETSSQMTEAGTRRVGSAGESAHIGWRLLGLRTGNEDGE